MTNSPFTNSFQLQFQSCFLILLLGLLVLQSCGDEDCIEERCNTECSVGDIEEWSQEECECLVVTVVVQGCTDELAINYNPTANCEDDSCEFTCPDPGTCNTDCTIGDIESWDMEECICEITEEVIPGCTDESATNYNPNANCDDSSCEIEGCTDLQANNFDPLATQDDDSCSYDRDDFLGDYLASLNCPDDPFLMTTSPNNQTFSVSEGLDSEDRSKVFFTFTSTAIAGLNMEAEVTGNKLEILEQEFLGLPIIFEGISILLNATFSGDFELNGNDITGIFNIDLELQNGSFFASDSCEIIGVKL